MISGILFSNFSDVLPALTYTKAIDNLWSVSLRGKTLRRLAKSKGVLYFFVGYQNSGFIQEYRLFYFGFNFQ